MTTGAASVAGSLSDVCVSSGAEDSSEAEAFVVAGFVRRFHSRFISLVGP